MKILGETTKSSEIVSRIELDSNGKVVSPNTHSLHKSSRALTSNPFAFTNNITN